jgi:uncharacterized protein (TIGR02145 family)
MRIAVLIRFALLLSAFSSLILVCNPVNAQDKGTFADTRDGHVYNWIKAGKQAWMIENLKFNAPVGSWVYNNDTANAVFYGRLYTWATATKACPKGWHLPTDADWTALIAVYGGESVAAVMMNKIDSANINGNPKIPDTFKNFSTLMGGVRHADSTFSGLGQWGGFWSATPSSKEKTKDEATNYLVVHGGKSIGKSTNSKNAGFSVRCVRNK